jgi:hypothetical protein
MGLPTSHASNLCKHYFWSFVTLVTKYQFLERDLKQDTERYRILPSADIPYTAAGMRIDDIQ